MGAGVAGVRSFGHKFFRGVHPATLAPFDCKQIGILVAARCCRAVTTVVARMYAILRVLVNYDKSHAIPKISLVPIDDGLHIIAR